VVYYEFASFLTFYASRCIILANGRGNEFHIRKEKMKSLSTWFLAFGCIVILTLCSGCAGVGYFQFPPSHCWNQPTETSHTIAGFTHDGSGAVMVDTTYWGNTKYEQFTTYSTGTVNPCGRTVVSGTIVTVQGDSYSNFGGFGGNPFLPGNAATMSGGGNFGSSGGGIGRGPYYGPGTSGY